MKQSLSDNVTNRCIKNNLPYHYNGKTGQGYYVVDGIGYSKEYIDDKYPVDADFEKWNKPSKGENPNKKGLL